MELLNEYVVPLIVAICLCVGYIVKQWVKDVDNKFIPTIVCVLGIVISIWNSNWSITPEIIAIGLASGLASTGMYELVRQFINKNKSNNEVYYVNGNEFNEDKDGDI